MTVIAHLVQAASQLSDDDLADTVKKIQELAVSRRNALQEALQEANQLRGQVAKLTIALKEFVDTIDAVGGITANSPVGAPDWPDLADAYEQACMVLNRMPKRADEDSEEESEEESEEDESHDPDQ